VLGIKLVGSLPVLRLAVDAGCVHEHDAALGEHIRAEDKVLAADDARRARGHRVETQRLLEDLVDVLELVPVCQVNKKKKRTTHGCFVLAVKVQFLARRQELVKQAIDLVLGLLEDARVLGELGEGKEEAVGGGVETGKEKHGNVVDHHVFSELHVVCGGLDVEALQLVGQVRQENNDCHVREDC